MTWDEIKVDCDVTMQYSSEFLLNHKVGSPDFSGFNPVLTGNNWC